MCSSALAVPILISSDTLTDSIPEADIHVVCYNFMPVFDWTRSELARERADGSTVLADNQGYS